MFSQKGFIPLYLLLGILLLTIGFFGGKYYSETKSVPINQEPNPSVSPSLITSDNSAQLTGKTKDWEVYENHEWGFKLFFPISANEYHFVGASSYIDIILPVKNLKTTPITQHQVRITSNSDYNRTPSELSKEFIEMQKIRVPNAEFETYKSTYDNKEGILVVEKRGQNDYELQRLFIKSDKANLELLSMYYPENREEVLKYFQLILSSIRFIK